MQKCLLDSFDFVFSVEFNFLAKFSPFTSKPRPIIAGCSSLTDVYCYATKVPSFIGTEDPSSMNDVFRKATLHVIYGNEEAYKADAWWKRFYKIEGCKDPGVEDVKVSSITISQTEITLKPDDTLQLEATVYPTDAANKSVIWKSSNEE